MRLRRIFLLVLVFCMLAGNAFGERSVCFYGFNSRSPGYTSFVKTHPGVKVRKNKKVYYNTKQILNDFITGKMPYDVFTLSTDSFDIYSLMGKGYLAPVTDNESIQSAMGSMYAPFREQLSYEGVLYGVPYGCSISYYAYDPDAWIAAGFTAEDVPTSFTSYLDFLERWVLRIQEKPENDIRVCGYFDERQYGAHSYTLYLVWISTFCKVITAISLFVLIPMHLRLCLNGAKASAKTFTPANRHKTEPTPFLRMLLLCILCFAMFLFD